MIKRLKVTTRGRSEFVDITREVQRVISDSGIDEGVVVVYSTHTTSGLTIQENADPGVQHDMLLLLDRIAPREDRAYRHIEANSASHLQASAMGFSQTVIIEGGRLVLGRWQGIYFCEFDGPRQRELLIKIVRLDSANVD